MFDELRIHAKNAIADLSQRDGVAREIEESISSFIKLSSSNQKITELAYLNMRIGD